MSAYLCGDPECPLCGESPAYAARMAQWAAEEEAQLRAQGRCLSCREPITEPAPSEVLAAVKYEKPSTVVSFLRKGRD